jgi:predicted carbohydrate-binding protein with CBM5 and CBM33 domain
MFAHSVILSAALMILGAGVEAHSYVTIPQSRSNQAVTQTGCRGPLCFGPCDAPRSKAGTLTPFQTARRNDAVEIVWPRNNHAGVSAL